MNIGFTGTRNGMSFAQESEFKSILEGLTRTTQVLEFHHGDCVGSDALAHQIVKNNYPSISIVVHPPSQDILRAYCQGNRIERPRSYLVRNRHIVDQSDILIATPKEYVNILKSGTWATIRYAQKLSKRVIVIFPVGSTKQL